MMDFKATVDFNIRKKQSSDIKQKYPNRIPVICEKTNSIKDGIPAIDKIKYLVPCDLTIGQFMFVIRKRIKLQPENALFFFINNNIPTTSSIMSVIYEKEGDLDGFLYIKYSGENTFG